MAVPHAVCAPEDTISAPPAACKASPAAMQRQPKSSSKLVKNRHTSLGGEIFPILHGDKKKSLF